MAKSPQRLLAVASGGGHFEQLMLLRPAFEGHEVRFATTDIALAEHRGISDAVRLPDCNKDKPISSALCGLVALWTVVRIRPSRIVSTGAAPGFFCILAGRLIGAKTLWIDSVANGEELSMCGKLSKRVAHQCLTQWEHLEAADGPPHYHGAVL